MRNHSYACSKRYNDSHRVICQDHFLSLKEHQQIIAQLIQSHKSSGDHKYTHPSSVCREILRKKKFQKPWAKKPHSKSRQTGAESDEQSLTEQQFFETAVLLFKITGVFYKIRLENELTDQIDSIDRHEQNRVDSLNLICQKIIDKKFGRIDIQQEAEN